MILVSCIYKKRVFLILIALLLILGACDDITSNSIYITDGINSSQIAINETPHYDIASPIEYGKRYCDQVGPIDQTCPPSYSGINITDTKDVEKDYNDIEVKLKYDTYPLNAYVYVHIVNEDQKFFDVYSIPYIEKWDADSESWVRLSYTPDAAYYESCWYACEGRMVLKLNPYYVYEPIEEGTYRLIVFCGGKTYYTSNFNFVNIKEIDYEK